MGGYYVLFWTLRTRAGHELASRLDSNNYSSEETIELKIPVSLNFPLQAQGFQRVSGTVEHLGNYYKLVKQKLENDTLYVVCIPDHNEKMLASAMKDYVQRVTETPSTSKKAANFLSKLINDFESPFANDPVGQGGWVRQIQFLSYDPGILDHVDKIATPPPKI